MNTAVRAIPQRLYLFNVSDYDKVSGVFNGSICYPLNWKSVLYSVYSNSEGAGSASMESDERMLRCIWTLLNSFGTHLKSEPDRQDIVVVTNPVQKYLETQRVWLDYSLAVYVQGAKHARQLYRLERSLQINDRFFGCRRQVDLSDEYKKEVRSHAPFIVQFIERLDKHRKAVEDEFREKFLV